MEVILEWGVLKVPRAQTDAMRPVCVYLNLLDTPHVEVHHVHAALFIEDDRDQHGSDHIILSRLTSSPTSIKQYVQLRLVLENEHQTCIEFI